MILNWATLDKLKSGRFRVFQNLMMTPFMDIWFQSIHVCKESMGSQPDLVMHGLELYGPNLQSVLNIWAPREGSFVNSRVCANEQTIWMNEKLQYDWFLLLLNTSMEAKQSFEHFQPFLVLLLLGGAGERWQNVKNQTHEFFREAQLLVTFSL